MEFYQIADLEKLSGIKAHTIRIWEKRYNLIIPKRTDTNIRLYSNDQFKKILNLSTLIKNGYKISALAKLGDRDLEKLLISQNENADENLLAGNYIDELIASMLQFNEVNFELTLKNVFKSYGFFEGMVQVVYPFLKQTGMLWSVNNTTPCQEHFASSIIKRKIVNAIDVLPIPKNSSKRLLLFLPPNEWHEIGLLFANYILKNNGIKVTYLGQNVPTKSLIDAIQLLKPTHLFSQVTTNLSVDFLNDESFNKALTKFKLKLLLIGTFDIISPFSSKRNLQILKHPNDLLKILG